MKLKETLNLGKTDFPMKGNLANREPQWQAEWDAIDLYGKRQAKNAGKPSFVLHDGPPYANGNIHIGHSLNKISKDIIVRYKSMTGFRAPYIPGWDTHGLPIEQVLANKGVKRKELPRAEYLTKCRDYALSQVETQKADFNRLGVQGDWANPYITLQPEYEAAQIRVFGKMAEKGYIYKGLKPIYWSPSSESSLAEAEIEYQDVKSPSIYVAFKIQEDPNSVLPADAELIIWTTTPWTIPANLGISVNADYDYSVVKVQDATPNEKTGVDSTGRTFVVASELLANLATTLGWNDYEVVKTVKGSDLEYIKAKHPLYDRESLVINGDHVTLDAGTGLVHTAPGHGEDDYYVGKKYDLDVLSPVDSRGVYTAEALPIGDTVLEGTFYDKGNKIIADALAENGSLLSLEFFSHSYPHDWRTKKPVIYRATAQWFASIDKFRADILSEVEKVDWLIPWGKQRLYNMIRDRGDWVISRQRAWGVPLPIFYAENGEPILTKETTDHVASLFAEHGSIIWNEREAVDLLPAGFTHPGSPNGTFTKEKDIMDVWFDSGSSHEAVLRGREELSFPADLYLEGSDQYRGWFNSSITTSVAINGVSPYKAVLSQGFVLDGEGRKMSKSIGNVIAPEKVVKQYGADILRLWVASVDTESDVRVSMDILAQIAGVYSKIRNTMRFAIANSSDFDPAKDRVAFEDLRSVDQYLSVRLQQVIAEVRAAYDSYNFMQVYRTINNFLTSDLSAFYFDFAKDVVYIEAADAFERRAMQTVFYDVAVALAKLLTPIIPHTAEEIFSYLKEDDELVQLSEMPDALDLPGAEELVGKWSAFLEFRAEVNKALEVKRADKFIGKSLEAKVIAKVDSDTKTLLEGLNADIAQLLIVSQFELADGDGEIIVEHADGEVCPRCRAVRTDFKGDLCAHCAEIVEKEFPGAEFE
ncbi:MAG: isoleucine--tRNA ligase [Lactobacillales bacterium]|jgi:isoleucyl-tRNA synthetase|nr:isoleucine--tRNA ligase [Lactobacillales bacterium]